MVCNEEDADSRGRVTADEERVLLYMWTEQRSSCVGSLIGWLSELYK